MFEGSPADFNFRAPNNESAANIPGREEVLRGPWRVMEFTRIGGEHVRKGEPNQDAIKSDYNDAKQLLKLSGSDGISRCKKSHIGSQAAVIAADRFLDENIDLITTNISPLNQATEEGREAESQFVLDQIATPLIALWKDEVRKLAKKSKRHKDFSLYQATLACAAVTDKAAYFFSIGDMIMAAKLSSGIKAYSEKSANDKSLSLWSPITKEKTFYNVATFEGQSAPPTLIATDGVLELPDPDIKSFFDIKTYADFLSRISHPTGDDISLLYAIKT